MKRPILQQFLIACAAWCLFMLTELPAVRGEAVQPGDGGAFVFELDQVSGRHMMQLVIPQVWIEPDFVREPTYEGREIIRGALPLGSSRADYMGFAWDTRNSLLWLDLNRNMDLTDDNDNRRRSPHEKRSYQIFSNIWIQSSASGTPIVYDITVGLNSRGRTLQLLDICSGWEGDVTLSGTVWRVRIVDNMDGVIGDGDKFFIGRRDDAFWEKSINYDQSGIPVPGVLSLDGVSYRITGDFVTNDRGTMLLFGLTPTDMPSGTIDIDGYGIRRLVLSGTRNGETVVALYENPGKTVAAPAVSFDTETVMIDGDKLGFLKSGISQPLTVPSGGRTALAIGCPLKNLVLISRNGPFLMFNYRLTGGGGELYPQRVQPYGIHTPTFSIYRNDRKIGTGTFRPG
jgi:hypothetical protein